MEGRVVGDFSLLDLAELSTAIQESILRGESVFSFDPPERFPVTPELQASIQFQKSEAGRLAMAFAKRESSERDALLKIPAQPFYLRDPHITVGKRKSLLDR